MKSPRVSTCSPRRVWPTLALTALLAGCAQPAAPSPDREFVYDGLDHGWSSAGTVLRPLTIGPGDNPLSPEAWTSARSGWGPIERDRSNGEKGANDGSPLSIGGVTYARGLGAHANSSMTFALGGQCQAFTASVGVDDEVGQRGSVVFEVYADGAKLWDSGVMRGPDAARTLQVDLSGRNELRLVVTDAGDGLSYDHADWAETMLRGCTASRETPRAIRISAGGPAQTVNGVTWQGCESVSTCHGYVVGGFPYRENDPISGIVPPANEAIYQHEWTGGETKGVPAGETAFAFRVPLANGDYQVRLHFAELNKFAPGQRVFDVNVEGGEPELAAFDLFREAGGAGRALVRSLPVTVADGTLDIEFIRQVENAKVSAIEILPVAPPPAQGQDIDLIPAEEVFSGVVNSTGAPQAVTLRNTGTGPLGITGVTLTGDHAPAFRIVNPPAGPLTLQPGESFQVQTSFAPGAVGALRAALRVESDDTDEPVRTVNLYGLSARGEQGNQEPPLSQIVQTLGYSIDVGSERLILGTGPAPIGDEVLAPLFTKAGPGPVTLRPVARYSPDDLLPFGYYTPEAAGPALRQVGVIALGGEQRLNPPLQPGGQDSFDPGDASSFGLYVGGTSYAPRNRYTQDGLNLARVEHAARVYPLKDRAGQPVANSYLVGFEPAVNGDYQDYVFVVGNVKPAPAAGPTPAPAPVTVSFPAWTPLLNGRDLSGWATWLPSQGLNRDPQGVFKVEDGKLHVLDLPVTDRAQEFGYVRTESPYADYRLRLRYRWGAKKFAPRAGVVRDAGLLYGMTGRDRLWPVSAEFQIQEHDTGDLWLIGGTNATVQVADPAARTRQYRALGTPYTTTNAPGAYGRVIKGTDAERLTDWNDAELIVSGDEATHILNGEVVNQLGALRTPDGAPLTSGHILLQAEGAEVWYSDVELRPLAYTPPPAGATVLFGGQDRSAWQMRQGGGAINWPVESGALVVNPSGGSRGRHDIRSVATYTDFRLHLEFKVPATDPRLGEQARGNSGVYLQGRYELQILDSFGKTLRDRDDLGALYGVRDASSNAGLPAGVWQSYDVIFRAARWSGGVKTGSAAVTAWLNGDLVHDNVQLPGNTLLGDPEANTPGPILLQDHGNRVQFRNIWVQPL